jgi:hypothetical protein
MLSRSIITLREYVQQQVDLSGEADNKFFCFSKEGQIVGKWATDVQRLEWFFGRMKRSNWVQVYVPRTDTGVEPMDSSEQPYGWTGCINDHLAESALWWAFEILTVQEAWDFMITHKPEVTFGYVENGVPEVLNVKFDGVNWIII